MKKVQEFKPLLMDGVKGQVFTMNLFKDDIFTFGRVLVMPNSAIPTHPHDTDCEWYLDADTGELVDFCPKGKSHSFVNDTSFLRNLISIKMVM